MSHFHCFSPLFLFLYKRYFNLKDDIFTLIESVQKRKLCFANYKNPSKFFLEISQLLHTESLTDHVLWMYKTWSNDEMYKSFKNFFKLITSFHHHKIHLNVKYNYFLKKNIFRIFCCFCQKLKQKNKKNAM